MVKIYVAPEDYESLKAALREALDAWESWAKRGGKHPDLNRIAALRAQFLDDK